MIKYDVVVGYHNEEPFSTFIWVVNSKLQEGWELSGGISVVVGGDGNLTWWQAITFEDKT